MLKSSHLPFGADLSPVHGAESPRIQFHVTSNVVSGWNVSRHGASRASRRFETKGQAVSFARDLAKRHNGQLVVHRGDGTIAASTSYRVPA